MRGTDRPWSAVGGGGRWRSVAAAGRDEEEKKDNERGLACDEGGGSGCSKNPMHILTYGEDEEAGYVLHQRTGRGRQAGRVGDGGTPHRVHSSRVEKRKAQGGKGGGRGGVTYLVGLCARPDGCGEALLRRRDANVLHLLEQLKCSFPLPGGPARFHLNGQNTMTPSG